MKINVLTLLGLFSIDRNLYVTSSHARKLRVLGVGSIKAAASFVIQVGGEVLESYSARYALAQYLSTHGRKGKSGDIF